MMDKPLNTITRKQLITGIIIFYITIGIAYFFMPVLEDRMRWQRESNIGLILIFNTGWILWGLLTPLVIYIAKKIPVLSGTAVYENILKHLLIAVLLVIAEFLVEYTIEVYLAKTFYHMNRDIYNFFYSFLYKFHTYLILYFLIVFIVQSIQYLENYKRTAEKNAAMQSQLLKAQLQSLKTQIQPHFLFNTHNTIMSLIQKGENEKAARMVTELSTLLRSSLDSSGDEFTSVAKEIEITRCYLNIHLIRFEDRLSIGYNIDPATETLSIPSFLLQPLVENAVTHGVSPYKQNGLIEINTRTNKQTITVEIRDNGENTEEYGKEGIGLLNTRRRLMALFGENNFLLELRKHPEKGSIALVQFPVIPFNFTNAR